MIASLAFLSVAAWAVRPADPTVLSALQQDLVQFHALEQAYDNSLVTLRKARKGIDPDLSRVAKLSSAVDAARQQRDAAGQRIIDQTLLAYGIRPRRLAGTIVAWDFKGVATYWRPRFGDEVPQLQAIRPDGTAVTMIAPLPEYYGIRWPDGRIVITPRAFLSPAFLAAQILHETEHHDQLITPGEADKKSLFLLEQAAHATHWKYRYDLKLTTDEQAALERNYTDHMEAIRRGAGSPGVNHSPASEETSSLSAVWQLASRLCDDPDSVTQAELDAFKTASDRSIYGAEHEKLVVHGPIESCTDKKYITLLFELWQGGRPAKGAELASTNNYPKQAEVPDYKPPVVASPGEPPKVPFNAAERLASLAKKACVQSLVQADLADIGWFPTGDYLDFSDSIAQSLSGCELAVFQRLLELNKSKTALTVEAVLSAIPYTGVDGGGGTGRPPGGCADPNPEIGVIGCPD